MSRIVHRAPRGTKPPMFREAYASIRNQMQDRDFGQGRTCLCRDVTLILDMAIRVQQIGHETTDVRDF
ncbi:UNVERIFIED_CONTAM: hypothetical protein C7454_13919 [Acidovorax defluvii]